MELEVLHVQRVPSPVLRKSAAKVGDRVDELIRDVQQELCIQEERKHVRSALMRKGDELNVHVRTSSTSGSILTFGSMLDTRSWMERRMLWSPGVDFLLPVDSSATYISSVPGLVSAGAPVII